MKTGLMLAASLFAQAESEPTAGSRPPPPPPPAGDAGVVPYPAAFFAEARPTNAFDMLQRLPGFTFDPGDDQVRGFSGAAGNVLIDGERPTSKATSLEDQLRRIPASQVERVEIIRGSAPGIDMQGRSLVANVVRSRAASSTAAVTAGVRAFPDDWLGPQADLEWSRRAGGLSLEAALHATWERDAESGEGPITWYGPTGAVQEAGRVYHNERGPTYSGSGAAELIRGADTWRLNLGGEKQRETTLETVRALTAAGRPLGDSLLTEVRRARNGEVGADWERRFGGGWSARLIALQSLSKQTSLERETEPGEVEESLEDEKSGESIVRATVTAQRSAALTIEAGAEGAFNFLESVASLSENGVPIVLPNANVRVEERRADGFVTLFWKPRPWLNTEFAARAEVSRISQSGDTRLTRSFFFPKPRAVVSIAPDEATQIRLRVEREVGQLDFADFAASSELGGGVVNVGNPDLEPERAWVFEAALERRFWGEGAIVLTLRHEEVQQVVDLIPIAGRFDAPGNIGDGVRDQAQLQLTLPLDRLGLAGGLVTAEGTWRRSRVTDPVTGARRRISEERPFEGTVRLTQDVERLRSTWGLEGTLAFSETAYRIDEVRKVSYESYWTFYWDWKPSEDLSIRAELQNLTGREFRRTVVAFDGPRSRGLADEVERRVVRFDPYVFLRVRKAL